MTTRLLPASEWAKLAATDLPQILPYVDARDLDVIVVEDDAGTVVGCWGLMPMLHLEGLWIAPAYRGKVSVARRLLTATWAEVKRRAPRWVMTAAADDEIRTLLVKHMNALHVPSDTYLIPMHGEKKCQSLL
jgi:hypothetical protein